MPPPTEPDFTVQLAQPHHERAVRLLLPDVFAVSVRRVLFVATTGSPPQVVGAAVLIAWPRGRPPGFKLLLRVAKPFRRRGIGKALLHAAMDEARARQMQALYAPLPVTVGSAEAAAWAWLGFTAHLTENHYESDPRIMLARLEPLCAKMQSAGWIPADAKITPLADAPVLPVAHLHAKYLGGTPSVLAAAMRGQGDHNYHPTASLVLMLGAQVVGLLLCHRPDPHTSHIDATVVIPELRLGWANALLKLHAARNAVHAGITKICYSAYETHPDTRQMADSTGAQLVKTSLIPYRLL